MMMTMITMMMMMMMMMITMMMVMTMMMMVMMMDQTPENHRIGRSEDQRVRRPNNSAIATQEMHKHSRAQGKNPPATPTTLSAKVSRG